jgi:hypothetical protein
MTKIHLLTATPMGILIVYHDRLWHFRVLANTSNYGQANGYYTAQAAEEAGRQWVGAGW